MAVTHSSALCKLARLSAPNTAASGAIKAAVIMLLNAGIF